MKKPIGFIVVIIINILKMAVTVLPALMLTGVTFLSEGNAFRQGVESGLGGSITAELLGELWGQALLAEVVMAALIIVICKRKYVAVIALLVVQILWAVSAPLGLMLAVIMLLIVLLDKGCKEYLKSK